MSWLLAGLPFDARSRRAIDETLLDWEGEATEAKTLAEVTGAELHGVASIVRVTSLSVLRESVDFSWLRGLGRRFAVAGGVVGGVALVLSSTVAGEFAISSWMLWFVPTVTTMALPGTLLLIIAWRPSGRRMPSLGASWIAGMTAVIVIQLLTVLAGELFMFLMYRDLGIERPASRPFVWLLPRVLLAVFLLGSIAGSALALAASLAKGSGLQSRWWLVGIPVMFLLLPAGAQFAIRLALLSAGLSEYRAYTDPAVAFGFVAALLVLAAKFGSRHSSTGEAKA